MVLTFTGDVEHHTVRISMSFDRDHCAVADMVKVDARNSEVGMCHLGPR